MSRFLFAAFAFMVLFSVASAARCRKNEVYTDCGSACPATCARPNPGPCTLQCVQGCFCKPGLVRDSNGKCVPPSECECDE
ncbi:chymotrypsin-elastase inhibitor ixodidin-like isoform X2 [Andrena cerasifolii]|uniref:chymotrypsin-elastase inhibitor ixodidin-like isoform X2 n=1 Tax=Andrena cerasifolii TaxID=2819439 RepID=UPI004037D318